MKKSILTFLLISAFCAAVTSVFCIISINMLRSDQLQLTYEITGKMAGAFPEKEEDIALSVLNGSDRQAAELGKKVLQKYGYDSKLNVLEDIRFKESYTGIILSLCAFFAVISASCLLLLIKSNRESYRQLKELSHAVEGIFENRLEPDIRQKEGMIGLVYSQLLQISGRTRLSIEKLNREKENVQSLVTDISHQVKTPLSSIKLFNTMLLNGDADEAETKEFLNRSRDEINRLEWLTGSLIKISRLESGMIEIAQENCSLNETVRSAMEGVVQKAEEKSISIELKADRDFYALHDPKWTCEAVFNILENGVKYTGSGGRILLQLMETEFFIRLDITDNGIGIPKEEYNEIFKRFYRGRSEMVRKTEGSGVGLYLARKILEEQGGSIIVGSTPGSGTRFSLFLQKCKPL
ncbi:MAG TPA: HAMP domain-containing sensor histidine kinase [Clostridia bacterium]|nr:HAMP domain-containing sensor histidine kinase [Clostridia bacterium]